MVVGVGSGRTPRVIAGVHYDAHLSLPNQLPRDGRAEGIRFSLRARYLICA